jgi:hypothetical protein
MIQVLWQGFKCDDSSVTHKRRCQQRVKADVGSDVENDGAVNKMFSKKFLFLVFITSQPTTVIARTGNPFLSFETAL